MREREREKERQRDRDRGQARGGGRRGGRGGERDRGREVREKYNINAEKDRDQDTRDGFREHDADRDRDRDWEEKASGRQKEKDEDHKVVGVWYSEMATLIDNRRLASASVVEGTAVLVRNISEGGNMRQEATIAGQQPPKQVWDKPKEKPKPEGFAKPGGKVLFFEKITGVGPGKIWLDHCLAVCVGRSDKKSDELFTGPEHSSSSCHAQIVFGKGPGGGDCKGGDSCIDAPGNTISVWLQNLASQHGICIDSRRVSPPWQWVVVGEGCSVVFGLIATGMIYLKYILRKDPLIMMFERSPALQGIVSSGTGKWQPSNDSSQNSQSNASLRRLCEQQQLMMLVRTEGREAAAASKKRQPDEHAGVRREEEKRQRKEQGADSPNSVAIQTEAPVLHSAAAKRPCKSVTLCEHSLCAECGGIGICEHQRVRSQCKACGGSSICEHQRRRSQCKDCQGDSICEHQRVRSRCQDVVAAASARISECGVDVKAVAAAASASTSCGGAGVENAVAAASASTSGREANTKTAKAEASASTSERGAAVENVAVVASVSTSECGADVRNVVVASCASTSECVAAVKIVAVEASASTSECGANAKFVERSRTRQHEGELERKWTRNCKGG